MAVTSGFKAVSFYNPDDGTVVQINEAALERVDFSQTEMEPDKTDPSGGHPFVGNLSELEVETWDFSGRSQLETWSKNDTRISMFAAGVQSHIQWYERDRISISVSPKSERGQANTFVIRMRREGQGEHDIHNNVNVLGYAGWRDSDGDSDGVPDSYTNALELPAFADADADGEAEQFAGHGKTDGSKTSLLIEPVIPVSGISLTLSIDVDALHDDGDTNFELVARSFAGSAVASALNTHTSTGRKTLSIDLPANTYKLQVRPLIVRNATVQNAKAKISDPALRIDGSDTFTKY